MALREVVQIAAQWDKAKSRIKALKETRDEVRTKESDLTAQIDALQLEIDQLEAQFELLKGP
jgi:uncharacterized coiled-coil DUF342 family protein